MKIMQLRERSLPTFFYFFAFIFFALSLHEYISTQALSLFLFNTRKHNLKGAVYANLLIVRFADQYIL